MQLQKIRACDPGGGSKGHLHCNITIIWGFKKEVMVMSTVIVTAAFTAVLIAKWNYFAKMSKNHK